MKTTPRRAAMLLGTLALIGMGGVTACSQTGEKHETPKTSVSTPAPSSTEKAVRTNVTRAPMSVAPQGGGHNGAVPCGFGPAGGGPCSNN